MQTSGDMGSLSIQLCCQLVARDSQQIGTIYVNKKSDFMIGYRRGGPSMIFLPRRFSESRSSNGSTPSVCPSVRPSVCPSKTLQGYQVCVICNSKSIYSISFKLCQMIVHILKMCTSYFEHVSFFFFHF